jgi:epoxyqueuosine reductase QueG
MTVSRVDHNLQMHRQERIQLQDRREEDYRKVVEKRNIDRIIAERVARNVRLDLDKGRYVDVEC